MARKSRLLQILTAAEDLLLFFDDYFKSTSWIYHDTGINRLKVKKSVWYLVENNILNKDLSFKKKPSSVFKEISRSWDGFWRIIIYDVSEKNRKTRDNIRYHLNKFDFKPLQRSVWVSPFSAEWIILRLEKIVDDPTKFLCFKAEFSRKNSESMVDELWELDNWIAKADNWLRQGRVDQDMKAYKREFWNLVLDHPRVPLDLLPRSWPLKKLVKKYRNL
jgi:DNA-binding transcriptional regulator PaaX